MPDAVIASGAKQSRRSRATMDCFVAVRLAMTVLDDDCAANPLTLPVLRTGPLPLPRGERECDAVIASAAKQSRRSRATMDCFGAVRLAMTGLDGDCATSPLPLPVLRSGPLPLPRGERECDAVIASAATQSRGGWGGGMSHGALCQSRRPLPVGRAGFTVPSGMTGLRVRSSSGDKSTRRRAAVRKRPLSAEVTSSEVRPRNLAM